MTNLLKVFSSFVLLLLSTQNFTLLAQSNLIEYPTINEELSINIEGDSIAVYALIAEGKRRKETIILLHGLPGHERNLDLAQELRRKGKNVIFFNYRGSWGSQGKFLYANCLEDITKVIDFFSNPINSSKYRVKENSFVLFGHSFGGGIALLSGAQDYRVNKIAVYSPGHIGTASKEELNWVFNYMKGLFMINSDPEIFYSDLIENKESYNILNYTNSLLNKRILIFDENSRNKDWISQISNAEYIIMDTDHSFSNKRTELIDRVVKWIE